MEKFPLSEKLLNKLRCSLCDGYLSYGPISLFANTGSVCGRCPYLQPEQNIPVLRETNYEMLAKNLLLFPCRYQSYGCDGSFEMDDIPTHEPSCSFKPFFCPVMPLGVCAWQGPTQDIQNHFGASHKELLLINNVFEVDIITNYSFNILMIHNDTLFVLHKNFNNNNGMFSCGIYQINNCDDKRFEYSLEFKIKTRDALKRITLNNKEVHWFKHENDVYNDCFKINKIAFLDSEYPQSITCAIIIAEYDVQIVEKDISDDFYEDLGEELQVKVKIEEDKMLRELECPVCQEYMISPIYQCQAGHSMCSTCKPKCNECPMCKGPLGETRNYALENLTQHMMYPCKFNIDGCTHRANGEQIKDHEKECKFSPCKCPLYDLLECEWKGLHRLVSSHVKIQHENYIITRPYVLQIEYVEDETKEEQKITRIFGNIFRIRIGFNCEKREFYSTVQMVGSKNEAKMFMYEVRLIDLKNKCLEAKFKKFCGSINEKKNDISHCSIWALNTAKQFMSEEKVLQIQIFITQVQI